MFDSRILGQNLRLMGFKNDDPQQPSEELMFETSNHKGFQQVMFFLLSELDGERAKNEFKNCYPALDKKQEAEFRKKVATWMKELHRANPAQCPHLNPSLLLSPGGRKFIDFFSKFITHVQNILLARKDIFFLKRAVTKDKEMQRKWMKQIILQTEANIKSSVNSEAHIKETIESGETVAQNISKKVFEMKARKTNIEKELEAKKNSIQENSLKNPIVPYDELKEQYKQEFVNLRQKIIIMKEKTELSCELAEDIMNTTDQSREKPSVDFTAIPPELVNVTDLLSTMENLLQKGLAANLKVRDQNLPDIVADLPLKELKETIAKLLVKSKQLKELKNSLELFHEDLSVKVEELSNHSYQIDWKFVFGGSERGGSVTPDLVLLPPTPRDSLNQGKSSKEDTRMCHRTPDVISRLKLMSPANGGSVVDTNSSRANLKVPGHIPVTSSADSPAGLNMYRKITPDSSPSTFKISRKITPENSPLLKATLERNLQRLSLAETESDTDKSVDKQVATSVGHDSKAAVSVEEFRPALCSTMRTDQLPVIQINKSSINKDDSLTSELEYSKGSTVFSSEGGAASGTSPSCTADKIKKYRKILMNIDKGISGSENPQTIFTNPNNSEEKQQTNAKSPPGVKSLNQIWDQVVQVISPRTSPVVGNHTPVGPGRRKSTGLNSSYLTPQPGKTMLNLSAQQNLEAALENEKDDINETTMPIFDTPDKMTLEEFMERVAITGDYDLNMDRILSEDLDDRFFLEDNENMKMW